MSARLQRLQLLQSVSECESGAISNFAWVGHDVGLDLVEEAEGEGRDGEVGVERACACGALGYVQ